VKLYRDRVHENVVAAVGPGVKGVEGAVNNTRNLIQRNDAPIAAKIINVLPLPIRWGGIKGEGTGMGAAVVTDTWASG
jgi:hypothetical protein